MTARSRFRLAAAVTGVVLAGIGAGGVALSGFAAAVPIAIALGLVSVAIGVFALDLALDRLVLRPSARELAEAVEARRRDDLQHVSRSLVLQHDLRRAETLGFAGKFCSALAHEISTPLNVIAGRIAIARSKLPSESPAREDLNIVLAQTERIGGAIRSLLEPLRVPPPTLTATDLREIVDRLVASLRHLAEARSVELSVSIAPDIPRLRADARQLEQVLASLLTDAVETLPAGGQVTLRAVRVRGEGQDRLEISIHESGAALSAELLARVFDPIYPTKAQTNGTSLALATARDILRGHSGELSVDSEVGAGTTFTCSLPIIEEDRQ